ncbi:MAG: sulfatase-like hydrolase/transferase [Chloroflexota bacterium]
MSHNKPNIILINCDDLGYGDLGCYGNEINATPNLDAMAEQGLRLTNFYSAAAWCMPSRKGLMTGIHPYRDGIDPVPALAEKYTMAEMLKDSGYRTALIGKWHLGLDEASHPNAKSFDYFYGTRGSNDWDGPGTNYKDFKYATEDEWQTPFYENGQEMGIMPQSQFTQRYTERVIDYVKENKSDSFFLYLAHNMPHVPLFPSPAFKGKSKGGVYGDVVEELDWSMGEILQTLRNEGLAENTLIVFTSDNGPWTMFQEFGGTAGPLRGEKSTCWEGGPRVPTIISWPGTIQPAVCEAFMVNIDLFATFAVISGASLQPGQAADSLDMSQVLFDDGSSPRENYLFCHRQPLSYISGDFKIHFASLDRTRHPDTGAEEPLTIHNPPLLFKLDDDISEATNVAGDYPADYARLQIEFQTAVADILGE